MIPRVMHATIGIRAYQFRHNREKKRGVSHSSYARRAESTQQRKVPFEVDAISLEKLGGFWGKAAAGDVKIPEVEFPR